MCINVGSDFYFWFLNAVYLTILLVFTKRVFFESTCKHDTDTPDWYTYDRSKMLIVVMKWVPA